MSLSTRPSFSVAMDLANKAGEMRGIDPLRIVRRERTKNVAYARFGVVWTLRQMGIHYQRIAEVLGFEDHTSVLYANRKAIEFRLADPDFHHFTDTLLHHAETLEPRVKRAA